MIKVLIIDDSRLVQQMLSEMLGLDPDIQIVGVASDPYIARDLIKQTNPDILTLDIQMPRMDGLTFLKNLMRLRPMPVIVISSLIAADGDIAVEALALGAVDYMSKPDSMTLNEQAFHDYGRQLIDLIKAAVKTGHNKSSISTHLESDTVSKSSKPPFLIERRQAKNNDTEWQSQNGSYQNEFLKKHVIAIGASTGGIEAIEKILFQLPSTIPPVLIVQHIKPEFTAGLAKRLHQLCENLTVLEASHDLVLKTGHIYIAPGNKHLTLIRQHEHYICQLDDSPPVNTHRPTVDKLFHSVASAAGPYAIGVLLTGMGSDGALGLKAIRDAKGHTIVQDERSSVVWGMPGSAVKIDAADQVLAISDIPSYIMKRLDRRNKSIA